MFTWQYANQFAKRIQPIISSFLIGYIPTILTIKSIMKNRPPFDLSRILMFWNFFMSMISWVGFFVLFPYFCNQSFIDSFSSLEYSSGTTGLVVFLFNLSKILEFTDTVFIVLRKKKLTFLHTFHHLVTATYSWSTFYYLTPLGLWYTIMNLLVRGIMYGYYAFKYFEIKIIPPIYLTTIQIIQMFWGLVLNFIFLVNTDTYDFVTIYNAIYGIGMYGSYLYLFSSFFSSRYKFKTEIKWSACYYLLANHIMAVCGIFRIDSWFTFAELILWYQICGLGVTAGMHRLWSHRSYKAKTPTRILLMILASMNNQGSIYHWCRDHRTHHKFSDTTSDPHDINRGFFYSHMGWLMLKKDKEVIESGKKLPTKDLLNDWVVALNHRLDPFWNQFWCFVVPGLYGIYRFDSFWDGLLIFGVLRWVIQLHATWCVNSVSHTFGYRPYKDIPPTDNLFTSILTYGEGWHNWHHAYPYDYAAAEDGILLQWNPTKALIDFLWLFGQTYDHKRKSIQSKKNSGFRIRNTE